MAGSSENKELDNSMWYRFSPNDQELIQNYLLNKILNRPLPNGHIIEMLDLYSSRPDELLPIISANFDEDIESELYFLMENRKMYGNSVIPVHGGIWVQVGGEKPVYVGEVIVGFRKDRVFEKSISSREVKSRWMVNEFRVNFVTLLEFADNKHVRNEVNKWIACRIIKTSKKSIVKRGSEDSDANTEYIINDEDLDW